jgi:hypothetical protein
MHKEQASSLAVAHTSEMKAPSPASSRERTFRIVGSGVGAVPRDRLQRLCYIPFNWTTIAGQVYCLPVTCYCVFPVLVVCRETVVLM